MELSPEDRQALIEAASHYQGALDALKKIDISKYSEEAGDHYEALVVTLEDRLSSNQFNSLQRLVKLMERA